MGERPAVPETGGDAGGPFTGGRAGAPAGSALRLLWASPCSALGLLLALPVWLAGGTARRRGCTLEFAAFRGECPPGSWLAGLPFPVVTLGHVVIATSEALLERWRAHERVHVAQYERLGPLLLAAYPLASLAAWLEGRHPYRGNRFEIEAYAAGPGPREDPRTAARGAGDDAAGG